ncbi:hypothetical protein F4780DRAFT_730517 [Xylariomycetidae sp. FL0641]|nr:hypothetical protein F4780DRAFT_730517 [Xylariomycetidae sp. FL0641]
MARLTQAPVTAHRSVSNPDSLTDLNRLLARLQQSILHADAERERRLRTSEYERNKASINLDYARTLLTKLEQDALSVKVHARRQEMQADLNTKRNVYEQLSERLRELEETAIDSDEDSSDDEDLLGSVVIPTPSQSSGSRSGDPQREDLGGEQEDEYEDESTVMPESRRADVPPMPTQSTMPPPQSTTMPAQAAMPTPIPGTTTSQTLRARGEASHAEAMDTAQNTGARSQLLGNRTSSQTGLEPTGTTATAEAVMDHHRAEQDKLTESMVAMARALRDSSTKFSAALREDQDVLESAGKGLERNERGLDSASSRMSTLRRLTEGEGWWGRMRLYAQIAGLAVFAVLLVFVFPKLRF